MTTYSALYTSPIGPLTITADEKYLKEIRFGSPVNTENPNKITKATIQQLKLYFSGKLKKFDLPLSPEGTEFQKLAWKTLRSIKYGKTISYSEQTQKMGRDKGFRAVGAANGRNPISIVIPCHRVVGKSGKLTGYAGGLDIKEKLLELERSCA